MARPKCSGPQKQPAQPPATAMLVNPARLRQFRFGWIVFVILATSLPYLYHWFTTPAGSHYTWILPPYPEDSLAYMAWSQQAAHGAWLFRLKYTALPHSPFLFQPFFLVCGWLCRLAGGDVGFVHWMIKSVGVVIFLVTFFKFTDQLGLSGFQSVVAAIFVGVSSGFGGLLIWCGLAEVLPFVSADLWIVDMNTFWSLLWNPLFPYALTLMLLVMYWLDRGTRGKCQTDFWLGGLAAGVLALIHPYSQLLVLLLATIIISARKRAAAFGCLGRFFLAALPFILYVVLTAECNPAAVKHSLTGEMKSPAPWAYACGFGLPLLLALAGLVVGGREFVQRHGLVWLWFVLALLLAYLPVWFQRKFIFGAHLPLCILAAGSLDYLLVRFLRPPRLRQRLVMVAVMGLPLLAATPVWLLVSEAQTVKANADGTYFVSDDLMAGFQFLRANSAPNDVVFATLGTSRLIPALAGNTVVWGHWAMSVDTVERVEWIKKLFSGQANWDEDQRAKEFWGAGIQYIFADGELKRAQEQNPQAWRAILRETDEVFTNRSVVIYRARRQ